MFGYLRMYDTLHDKAVVIEVNGGSVKMLDPKQRWSYLPDLNVVSREMSGEQVADDTTRDIIFNTEQDLRKQLHLVPWETDFVEFYNTLHPGANFTWDRSAEFVWSALICVIPNEETDYCECVYWWYNAPSDCEIYEWNHSEHRYRQIATVDENHVVRDMTGLVME